MIYRLQLFNERHELVRSTTGSVPAGEGTTGLELPLDPLPEGGFITLTIEEAEEKNSFNGYIPKPDIKRPWGPDHPDYDEMGQ